MVARDDAHEGHLGLHALARQAPHSTHQRHLLHIEPQLRTASLQTCKEVGAMHLDIRVYKYVKVPMPVSACDDECA